MVTSDGKQGLALPELNEQRAPELASGSKPSHLPKEKLRRASRWDISPRRKNGRLEGEEGNQDMRTRSQDVTPDEQVRKEQRPERRNEPYPKKSYRSYSARSLRPRDSRRSRGYRSRSPRRHGSPGPWRRFRSPSSVPCRFDARGYCRDGDRCRFQHVDQHSPQETSSDSSSLSSGSAFSSTRASSSSTSTHQEESSFPRLCKPSGVALLNSKFQVDDHFAGRRHARNMGDSQSAPLEDTGTSKDDKTIAHQLKSLPYSSQLCLSTPAEAEPLKVPEARLPCLNTPAEAEPLEDPEARLRTLAVQKPLEASKPSQELLEVPQEVQDPLEVPAARCRECQRPTEPIPRVIRLTKGSEVPECQVLTCTKFVERVLCIVEGRVDQLSVCFTQDNDTPLTKAIDFCSQLQEQPLQSSGTVNENDLAPADSALFVLGRPSLAELSKKPSATYANKQPKAVPKKLGKLTDLNREVALPLGLQAAVRMAICPRFLEDLELDLSLGAVWNQHWKQLKEEKVDDGLDLSLKSRPIEDLSGGKLLVVKERKVIAEDSAMSTSARKGEEAAVHSPLRALKRRLEHGTNRQQIDLNEPPSAPLQLPPPVQTSPQRHMRLQIHARNEPPPQNHTPHPSTQSHPQREEHVPFQDLHEPVPQLDLNTPSQNTPQKETRRSSTPAWLKPLLEASKVTGRSVEGLSANCFQTKEALETGKDNLKEAEARLSSQGQKATAENGKPVAATGKDKAPLEEQQNLPEKAQVMPPDSEGNGASSAKPQATPAIAQAHELCTQAKASAESAELTALRTLTVQVEEGSGGDRHDSQGRQGGPSPAGTEVIGQEEDTELVDAEEEWSEVPEVESPASGERLEVPDGQARRGPLEVRAGEPLEVLEGEGREVLLTQPDLAEEERLEVSNKSRGAHLEAPEERLEVPQLASKGMDFLELPRLALPSGNGSSKLYSEDELAEITAEDFKKVAKKDHPKVPLERPEARLVIKQKLKKKKKPLPKGLQLKRKLKRKQSLQREEEIACVLCRESGRSVRKGPFFEVLCGKKLDHCLCYSADAATPYYVHKMCGAWSTGVNKLGKGTQERLEGLEGAVRKAQGIVCTFCATSGASLQCYRQPCPKAYHYDCAFRGSCQVGATDLTGTLTLPRFVNCPDHFLQKTPPPDTPSPPEMNHPRKKKGRRLAKAFGNPGESNPPEGDKVNLPVSVSLNGTKDTPKDKENVTLPHRKKKVTPLKSTGKMHPPKAPQVKEVRSPPYSKAPVDDTKAKVDNTTADVSRYGLADVREECTAVANGLPGQRGANGLQISPCTGVKMPTHKRSLQCGDLAERGEEAPKKFKRLKKVQLYAKKSAVGPSQLPGGAGSARTLSEAARSARPLKKLPNGVGPARGGNAESARVQEKLPGGTEARLQERLPVGAESAKVSGGTDSANVTLERGAGRADSAGVLEDVAGRADSAKVLEKQSEKVSKEVTGGAESARVSQKGTGGIDSAEVMKGGAEAPRAVPAGRTVAGVVSNLPGGAILARAVAPVADSAKVVDNRTAGDASAKASTLGAESARAVDEVPTGTNSARPMTQGAESARGVDKVTGGSDTARLLTAGTGSARAMDHMPAGANLAKVPTAQPAKLPAAQSSRAATAVAESARVPTAGADSAEPVEQLPAGSGATCLVESAEAVPAVAESAGKLPPGIQKAHNDKLELSRKHGRRTEGDVGSSPSKKQKVDKEPEWLEVLPSERRDAVIAALEKLRVEKEKPKWQRKRRRFLQPDEEELIRSVLFAGLSPPLILGLASVLGRTPKVVSEHYLAAYEASGGNSIDSCNASLAQKLSLLKPRLARAPYWAALEAGDFEKVRETVEEKLEKHLRGVAIQIENRWKELADVKVEVPMIGNGDVAMIANDEALIDCDTPMIDCEDEVFGFEYEIPEGENEAPPEVLGNEIPLEVLSCPEQEANCTNVCEGEKEEPLEDSEARGKKENLQKVLASQEGAEKPLKAPGDDEVTPEDLELQFQESLEIANSILKQAELEKADVSSCNESSDSEETRSFGAQEWEEVIPTIGTEVTSAPFASHEPVTSGTGAGWLGGLPPGSAEEGESAPAGSGHQATAGSLHSMPAGKELQVTAGSLESVPAGKDREGTAGCLHSMPAGDQQQVAGSTAGEPEEEQEVTGGSQQMGFSAPAGKAGEGKGLPAGSQQQGDCSPAGAGMRGEVAIGGRLERGSVPAGKATPTAGSRDSVPGGSQQKGRDGPAGNALGDRSTSDQNSPPGSSGGGGPAGSDHRLPGGTRGPPPLEAVLERRTVPLLGKKLLTEDVTENGENVKIPCTNDVDDEPVPLWAYVREQVACLDYQRARWLMTDNVWNQYVALFEDPKRKRDTAAPCQGCQHLAHEKWGAKVSKHVQRITGSYYRVRTSSDKNTKKRLDWQSEDMCGRLPYDELGRLQLPLNAEHYIIECNSSCPCFPNCMNSVISRGLQRQLELKRTHGKGWGLFARERIFRGEFLFPYVGDIMTATEAIDRGKHQDRQRCSYLFNRDARKSRRNQEAAYTVDASAMGNIARFVNHSCEPNLAVLFVHMETLNSAFAHLAFFANRDVEVGEELTMDYNYDPSKGQSSSGAGSDEFGEDEAGDAIVCRCGTKSCRGLLKD